MKERRINIVFIIVFMIMSLTPLLTIDWNGGQVSEEENRILASRPPKSLLVRSPVTFIEEIDLWITDNTGFRKEIIDLYNKIDVIEKEGQYQRGELTYLIGEQGHEYYDRNGELIAKYQGKDFLTPEELSNLATGLNDIKKYLDNKGIPMVVMFCTDKETIYPEFYPKSIMRGPEPIQLDIITDYLKDNTTIDIFNIKEALLDQKDNYLLYDKAINAEGEGDITHYNEIGGFFAYQELMKHIKIYLPEVEHLTIEDIIISYGDNNYPTITLKNEISYSDSDENILMESGLFASEMKNNFLIEHTSNDLPNILVIRDSYLTPHYMKALPEHFSRTGLIHLTNMNYFNEFVEYYDPDIVVFESAERGLKNFATLIERYHNQ